MFGAMEAHLLRRKIKFLAEFLNVSSIASEVYSAFVILEGGSLSLQNSFRSAFPRLFPSS